ncbi:MAG: hypothetical protein KF760_08360 [Candidatus Eremiobacteraeota bacterium]|nr:hypothetical protein [Candidatus Eremiobacteraeota bacterium]MCW5872602.1 hypothetical protein [Candidatus Eremiobacteraeota bacterium]
MTLRALVQRLAQQELDWQGRHLLAPVVAPGRARVRLQGLVYEFRTSPADFCGFGVFALNASGLADYVRSASPPEREKYLKLWPRRQVRLLREVAPGSWLTPGGLVHEVERGSLFELVEVAFDGRNLWYCRPVLNTRLALAEEMARALRDGVSEHELHLKGLTPMDRAAFALLVKPVVGDDHERLARALRRGGGSLRSFSVDGDSFQVHWEDSRGLSRFSSIRRNDLTVLSSGICLSGRDSDFDLTSLVGVLEEEED